MRTPLICSLPALLLCGGFMAAPGIARPHDPAATLLRFAPGQEHVSVNGSVTGYQTLMYAFDGIPGREVTVLLKYPGQTSLYLNMFAPSGALLFNGSIEGDRFESILRERGRYTVQVYLMRNDARRGKRAAFTLQIRHSGAQAQETAHR